MSMAEEEAIFEAARQRPTGEEREQYVAQACGGDVTKRKRILKLLQFAETPDSFTKVTAIQTQPPPEPPPRSLGPYRLIEVLGRGGMGIVWRAEQTEPMIREVALKIVRPGMDTKQVLMRFEAERQALALMDHPNIAKVLDAGESAADEETGPRPYFVMELIRGRPVTQYCDEKKLPLRERIGLFIQVCRAVQHAHQKGIIHRDLKPSNVLVTEADGQPLPKVIDFGLAKAMGRRLTNDPLETRLGSMIGTLHYMSPEQAERTESDIDTRSDIYSLGVVLYELLTGTTPLEKERSEESPWAETLKQLREVDPPRPSTRLNNQTEECTTIAARRGTEPRRLCSELRGDLDWIAMKCLEKDRNRRYETVNALARDLERYLKSEPVEARPPSTSYRLRKFVRRNRVALATAAAFVIVLLVATVVSISQALRLREERNRVLQEKNRADDERNRVLQEKNRADEETATAVAISDFLRKDLLEQADISSQQFDVKRNPNITVRELLDRADKAVDGKFATQPRTEAAVRQTLGQSYRAVGEYTQAEKHLRRVVAIYLREFGPDHDTTRQSQADLANVMMLKGSFAESESILEAQWARNRVEHGAAAPETLVTMVSLGLLRVQQSRYAEAEKLLETAAAERTKLFGPDHVLTLECNNALAHLYYMQRKVGRAAELYSRNLEVFKKRFGPDHPSTLTSAGNYGAALMSMKRYDDAVEMLQEMLELNRARQGPDHPSTCAILENLAQAYEGLHRDAEAEELYKQSLEGRMRRQGRTHRDTLRAMQHLAVFYSQRGRFDDAEPLLKEALAAQRLLLGEDHHETVLSLNSLGVLERRRSNWDASEQYFRDALAAAIKTLTLKHDDTQEVIVNLSTTCYLARKPERAEAAAREFVAFVQAQLKDDIRTEAFATANLALNLLAQKKYAEAEPFARRSLELRLKMAPERWSAQSSKSVLGAVLAGRGKYADAEPLLIEGYEGLKRREREIPTTYQFHIQDGLNRIISLYETWGKPEEAAKWRAKR